MLWCEQDMKEASTYSKSPPANNISMVLLNLAQLLDSNKYSHNIFKLIFLPRTDAQSTNNIMLKFLSHK